MDSLKFIKTDMFGIGKLGDTIESKLVPKESMKFNLFPKVSENLNVLHHTQFIDEKPITFSLAMTGKEDAHQEGIFLKDPKCFEKVVDLFDSQKTFFKAKLHSAPGSTSDETVPLVGEILIMP